MVRDERAQYQLNSMHPAKIRNYTREHPDEAFPPFRPLTLSDRQDLHRRIIGALKVSADASPHDVARALQARSEYVSELDTDSDAVDWQLAFKGTCLESCEGNVYICWGELEDIDQMRAADFRSKLELLWYPSAEDIEIFDEDMKWVILMSHYGTIRQCLLRRADV